MENYLVIQRLSFIKYLYWKGEEQSRQSEVVAGFSILAFHDAIEMFLMLVYEHLDCGNDKNYKTIDDYLGNIPGVKMKESAKALNKCRNSLKHQGQFPSKADVEKHRVNSFSFLQENTSTLLGLDFDTISLIDLVAFVDCRNFLKAAQERREEENFFESVVETRKAFNSLLHDFECSKNYWYSSLFNIGRKPRLSYKEFIKEVTLKDHRDKHKIWFEDIDMSVKELRDVVKIISIGIDYKQYVLFNAIVPKVIHFSNDHYQIGEEECHFNNRVYANKELCDFCINFVVDSAVKMQESDYETSKYFKITH